MKKFIRAKLSGNILIISFIMLIVFHVFILLRILPYEIVWAGQINDPSSLVIYEGIAIFLTIVFILIITMKIGYIKTKKFMKSVNFGVWFIFVYLLLNTIGNLASAVTVEKAIFTPITIIMAILAFRLAIEKR